MDSRSLRGFDLTRRIDNSSQVGIVALSFLLATQYWPVREHVVFALLFAYACATFFLSNRSVSRKKPRLFTLAAFYSFLLWLVLSALWSPTPHLSLAYGLLSLLLGVSAVLQGLVIRIRNFAGGIVLGVGFQVAHALAIRLIQSKEAVPDPWGLYTNASSFSLVIGIGLIALPSVLSRSRTSWFIFVVVLAVFFTALLAANILTSFLALLGAFVAAVMVGTVRGRGRPAKLKMALLYVSIWLAGATVFWFFRGPILSLIGEDASLSERVPLWNLYFEAVLWRPILGSGWGSTVGWDFPLSPDRLAPVAEWFPAHNGYLDIALMLGFVGLGLFVVFLAALFSIALRDASDSHIDLTALIIPALLTYMMLNDMMATSFPKLIGIYLLGTLLGMTIAKSSDAGETMPALSRN